MSVLGHAVLLVASLAFADDAPAPPATEPAPTPAPPAPAPPPTAVTVPAPPASAGLQFIAFSPEVAARTGVPWQVTGPDGHALTAPELALAGHDTSINRALTRDRRLGRIGAAGFGVAGAYLLAAGISAVFDSRALVPYRAEDRMMTGAFLTTGGLFAFASATLVVTGVRFRRDHPSAWWDQDEGELLVSTANGQGKP